MLVALGDPMRQSILDRLSDRPMPVGRLAEVLPISRPAVSQHLRVLKDVGLVTDRQEGTRRLYQVDPDGVAALRAHLDAMWARSLGAFAQRVEIEVSAHEVSAHEVSTHEASTYEVSTHEGSTHEGSTQDRGDSDGADS
ncbi:ArsR/SmtB family transcription factor [Dactylosporangium darangshiense]|uniref:ArsR/SmtB family transcription factor n=1 Tax=Dactylosporangium darangshiense TaxID=579108 RepID=UPI00363926F3